MSSKGDKSSYDQKQGQLNFSGYDLKSSHMCDISLANSHGDFGYQDHKLTRSPMTTRDNLPRREPPAKKPKKKKPKEHPPATSRGDPRRENSANSYMRSPVTPTIATPASVKDKKKLVPSQNYGSFRNSRASNVVSHKRLDTLEEHHEEEESPERAHRASINFFLDTMK